MVYKFLITLLTFVTNGYENVPQLVESAGINSTAQTLFGLDAESITVPRAEVLLLTVIDSLSKVLGFER